MNSLKTCSIYLILGLLPALLISCGKEETATQTERSIAVNAQVVSKADQAVMRTFTGSLEGEQQAMLYAKLAEAVSKVHVREGEMVRANAVIVSLDRDGASARYNETVSLYRNSEKNFKKMENLFKEGAISELQFDGARTDYEVNKANFEAVSRLVDIRTPIAGQVTSVKVRPGDFVQLGQQLATIATPGKLRVKFAVNADDISFVRVNADVRVTSEVASDTIHGKIASIAESADPATRSFQVEAELDNINSSLKPGMFVKIQVTEQSLPQVVSIPRDAVLNLDNKNVAFVIVNGAAHRRELSLGPDLEGRVVVESGLQPGDTLVTLGQNYLDEGFKVTISSMVEG